MNIKSKLLGIATIFALAASSIAIAPAVSASTAAASSEVKALSSNTKTVVRELKRVEQHANKGARSLNRATTTCLRLGGMKESGKNRARLVQQAKTFIVSGLASVRASGDLLFGIDHDSTNKRQQDAFMRATGALSNGWASADVATTSCGIIPEMRDFFDGTVVVEKF